MQTLLDFAASDSRAGFRLHRLEVYNWGTFHNRIWSLHPGGENSLLTGDIGSGKSTLVDAVTTLLVPAQRITYNKAAGAEARERSLKSYVLGYYKSERAESGLAARAVALRDQHNYSVLLGCFHNEGFGQTVTLAQVFWSKELQGQPARLYIVAKGDLTIAEHFAGFGTDIADLRKRLRKMADLETHESFPAYGAAFRRRFGIENEQALELFNQTVSMKSVGNLTDFVRQHMLEPFPVGQRVEALIRHFDDLSRAHAAVLKAKAQIEKLAPLVADTDQHAALAAETEELRGCREALRPWFAELKIELLAKRRVKMESELQRQTGRIAELRELADNRLAERDQLKRAIADNGGDRIEYLRGEITRKEAEKKARRERAARYNQSAQALGLADGSDLETFTANRRAIATTRQQAQSTQARLQNDLTETGFNCKELKDRLEELQTEIDSLRRRRSNIPSRNLAIRDQLCAALEIQEQELPFAGELIRVREDQADWEGAGERLLHNFGLSLLVPDPHYGAVAAWVDRTRLKGRLVYYRVREEQQANIPELHPDSLVGKLDLKPDSSFYSWLTSELARRFDYACCRDLDQFRRERQAVTRAGQLKSGGQRHEKDDRHNLEDRSRYVLGWSNQAKLAALLKKAADHEERMRILAEQLVLLQAEQQQAQERLQRLSKLEEYENFRELDWRPLAMEIEQLTKERQRLETESDTLRILQEQLAELEAGLKTTEAELEKKNREQAVTAEKKKQIDQQLIENKTLLDRLALESRKRYFPQLEAMRSEAPGGQNLTVESCDNRQIEMRDWLQAKMDAAQKKSDRLLIKIIGVMRDYQNLYPLETREVDAGIEAAAEYRTMLAALQADDLPRFEARFKTLLNENTIREVANFQAQLNRERQAIRERIDTINRSLHVIDYNANRYITLLAEPAPDADIRDFQQELRGCTEGALTGSEDEQYTEAKFMQVKAIVEQFKGREGFADLDRRWTAKVTDVRNWFVFSASERWREDDREHEHYSDSGGKSGGQKEKLAYTVLAASLAYQFGLEWGEKRSRSFRFVVIDEAFGRGSDESTRYGLELFKRLNLQLLIITPLQKIHIIEPYVANVGFVHYDEGGHSKLRNLTIEEYRAEKTARSASG